MIHTLYVCYFGIREPLVQTQVLPYLRQLQSENLRVSLLTFEPNLHRGLKTVERHLLRVSDAFVLLTERAREIVFPGCDDADNLGRPIEVIPCCVDFARFDREQTSRESLRAELSLTGRRVIVYLGS